MEEARWVIDRWQLNYNHRRIHSALDYQTPAAYAADCVHPASASRTQSNYITPILSLVLDQSLGGDQPSTQLFQVSIPSGQSHPNHACQPGAVLRQASKVDGTSFTAASPSQFSLLFTRIPIIQPEHAPKPPA